MTFEQISFKNIFAYGEKLQTIKYSNEGSLILLVGKSGVGKSAILNLPNLLLYGKLKDVPKNAVANRINKHGWIQGRIRKGRDVYEITRTFVPNSLTIFRNGEDISNIGISDGQDFIDNEITEIPQETFNNLVTVSMKRFKSFLKMSPADRKQIIDRVFNVEIVNFIFEKIKGDRKEIGNLINQTSNSMFSVRKMLENANYELQKIQQNQTTEEDKKILNENLQQIQTLTEQYKSLNETYSDFTNKYNDVYKKVSYLDTETQKATYEINTLQEKINLFSQEKCPTCGSLFAQKEFQELKKLYERQKQEKTELTNKIAAKRQEMVDYMTGVRNKSQEVYNKLGEINRTVTGFQQQNAVLQQKMSVTPEQAGIMNIINNAQAQLDELTKAMNTYQHQMNLLDHLMKIYSLDGVKQMIINNYIPLLNKEITKNLLEVEIPYSLSFDSKFEPTLSDLGEPIPVGTLSDGEMTRIDVVILCSLLKLLKRRFPSINVFSCDELLSSLDIDTAESVLRFLKNYAMEMKLNMFIVSHVSFSTDFFDRCIEVTRDHGFADITEAVLN